MADSHSAALQEAYLVQRFEQETGRKATSKVELLEWLAMSNLAPEGPDFETWVKQQPIRL